MDKLDEVLARIAAEVRPKLDESTHQGGYDCCGCSSYDRIVEDIEAIVREVRIGEKAIPPVSAVTDLP